MASTPRARESTLLSQPRGPTPHHMVAACTLHPDGNNVFKETLTLNNQSIPQ